MVQYFGTQELGQIHCLSNFSSYINLSTDLSQ